MILFKVNLKKDLSKADKGLILKIILRSKYKRKIIYFIRKRKKFMGKDLVSLVGSRSHLSRTLKELEYLNLILCNNKRDRNFKIYEVTSFAKEIFKEFEEYYDPKKDFSFKN